MKKKLLPLFVPFCMHGQNYELPLRFDMFTRWTYEVKEQKRLHFNGRVKSFGYFRLYTVNSDNQLLAVPVNRHLFYRANGRLKKVFNYSEDGVPQNDSIYKRGGRLKKVFVYKKP